MNLAKHILILPVPNLSVGCCALGVEQLFRSVVNAEVADTYQLDFQNKALPLAPAGVLAIIVSARMLFARCNSVVELVNIDPRVHSYLHRIQLFERANNWLATEQSLAACWDKIPQSPNVLDVTFLNSSENIIPTVEHAEAIFERWLPDDELPNLGVIISELCANICRHSTDNWGCLLIQKYEPPSLGYAKVCLAFADLGVGIRGSLATCHPNLPPQTIGCLKAAMNGRSARGIQAIGTGLSGTTRIARKNGGHLILRSHDAALWMRAGDELSKTDLVFIPGAQLAVEFRAPLRQAA